MCSSSPASGFGRSRRPGPLQRRVDRVFRLEDDPGLLSREDVVEAVALRMITSEKKRAQNTGWAIRLLPQPVPATIRYT